MKLFIKVLTVVFLVAFAAGLSTNWQLVIALTGLNIIIWSFPYGYFILQAVVAILVTTVAPVGFFYWIGSRNDVSVGSRKLIAAWIFATYFGYLIGVAGSILLYHKLIYPYDVSRYLSSPEFFVNQLLVPGLLVSLWSLYMFFAGFFGYMVGSNRRQAKKSSL